MKEIYSIALEEISIDEYEGTLKNSDLLPGRRILQGNIEKHFDALKALEIQNLKELTDAIKTDEKRSKLSKQTGISEEYLMILRREINGFIPKPVDLSEFPEIDKSVISKLAKIGIKSSKQLFEKAISKADRKNLSDTTGSTYDLILLLSKFSDLCRVNGIGPTFARMLCDVGCDTVSKLSNAKTKYLFDKLLELNQKKHYTKAKFTEKDMEFCIRFAKKLPHSIEYYKSE